jgi:hypothetical protein
MTEVNRTVAYWVKVNAFNPDDQSEVVSRWNGSLTSTFDRNWQYGFNQTGNLHFASGDESCNWDGDTVYTFENTAQPTGQWLHVVWVQDGTIPDTSVYVNGSFIDNKTHINNSVCETNVAKLWIGAREWGQGSEWFNGTIDEVASWNRTLSQDEILDLYRLGEGKYYWSANASDGVNTASNGTNEFTIGSQAPTITLNTPENQSITSNNYALLNITVTDPDSDNTTIFIFAGNDSSDLNTRDGLVYYEEDVTSGSEVTYNFTSRPVQSDDPNLVLLMHFDNRSEWGENTSQQGRVYDFSGNGNNGTLGNDTAGTAPTWNATGGKLAGAFEFDGNSNFIRIPDSASLDYFSDEITISAWIYINDYKSGWASIVAREYDAVSANLWYLGFDNNNNTVFYIFTSSDSYPKLTGNVVPTNEWIHLVGRYNGSDISLYVNGVFNSSDTHTGNFPADDNPVYIGADTNDEEATIIEYFNGTIDEVAIWNRSLTADEILDLYRLGYGKYYWSANASDGVNTASNGTNEFTVLNITVTDQDGDNTTVYIFAGNDSSDLNTRDGLVFYAEDVSSDSFLSESVSVSVSQSTDDAEQNSPLMMQSKIPVPETCILTALI